MCRVQPEMTRSTLVLTLLAAAVAILSAGVVLSGATVLRTTRSQQQQQPFNAKSIATRSLCQYNGAVAPKPGTFYQLPATVTPSRYRLRFRLDAHRQKLYGHSLINVYIHNQTNIIELNSVNLVINGASFRTRNVQVDARMVYYCPEKETIVLHFNKYLHKGSGNLTITFSGNLTEMAQSGFMRTQTDTKLVMTDFGPIDSRRNFPSWDEPKFKAHFDLYLIVPRNNMALFNMPSIRRRPYSPQFDEVRFENTPLMSTFQLANLFAPKFHIANISTLANFSTASRDNNISLQIYSSFFHSNEDWLYALETSEKMLKFYQYYFDYKYPLSKLDLVALRNYEQTSIEKMGLVIFDEKQLVIANRTQASEEELKKVAETLGHSLAHQWIGNIVTFEQWNEFWLFEALATFMEKEALDSLFPHWKGWERFTGDEMRKALQADANRFSKPLDRLITHPNDILQMYPNENGYVKAVALLRMLKQSIGEETFQKGIRLFVKTYPNRAATADNLWDSFQLAIGKATQDEMGQFQLEVVRAISKWTKMAGFPIIHVQERQEGEARVLKMRQERFVESTANQSSKMAFPNSQNVWPIPVSIVNSFNPFSPTHQAIITDEEVELSINEIWEGEWVKLNPEFSNFYRVRYSDEMLDKFGISIEEKLLSPMDRLNLVDDLFALIRSGHVATDVGLRFVWNYENEDNPNVWAVIVSALGDIDILTSNNETLRTKYRKFGQELLNKLYTKLGWYPETNLPPVGQKMRVEDFAQRKLRENILCLMAQLKAQNFSQVANKKFNDYLNGESDLSVGLLECSFRSFSSFPSAKNQTTFAQLFKFYKDYDLPEARHLFSFALGSTEKSNEISKVIDFSLESIVRPEDAHIMLKELSLKSSEGRRQVIGKIQSKFFSFAQKFANFNSVHHLLKDIIETFSSVSQVGPLEKLLVENANLKVLQESLRHSFEKVAIFERWIMRDQEKMAQFFDKAPLQAETFDDEEEGEGRDNNSNNNNSVDENNFFDFEEFDK